MSNGVHLEAAEFLGPRQLINRHEYIRLLEQSLHRLGFSEAANLLERDSVRRCADPPDNTMHRTLPLAVD